MLRTCLMLLLAAALTACGARQAKTERKGRIITLTDTILDTGGTDTVRFGHLHSGEIAQLRLWLANETARPLVIAKYDRSCGCTTLEYDSQPINAGDAQQVTLTFDARGEWGWQLKTLDVSFAGAHRPLRLFIEAEVE
ncbi:MAG: DUF1573 domain-containing protein [Alistipes sp.]|nr:DUF1573 domain-containing protein [Alistipes sp.]